MTVRDIVEMADDGEEPDATVLFIPNFYMAHEYGRYESTKIAALMDLLYSRAARSKPTVIHLSDTKGATEAFGEMLSGLLSAEYVDLSAGADHE
jgi:aspartate carbamoyltransferase catalytic subunit